MSQVLLRLVLMGLAALALFAGPMSVLQVQGAPVVNCDASGTDLQSALNNAPNGATIQITGTCDDGPYVIRKDLNLQGPASAGAIMSAPANSEFVLFMRGVTVKLRNLTIDANHAANGVLLEGGSLDVERVIVRGASGSGLRVDGSSFAIVSDSEFNENGESGVLVIWSSNTFLFQAKMQNNGIGMIVVNNGSASGSENQITNNNIGLLVSKMSSAGISDTLIANNLDKGVWIANQYGYIEAGVNTIQDNGTDVVCEANGIFESPAAQTSSTGTENIDPDCTVLGTIF